MGHRNCYIHDRTGRGVVVMFGGGCGKVNDAGEGEMLKVNAPLGLCCATSYLTYVDVNKVENGREW